MPYSDHVIDAGTLDEVWRLLCALVGRDSRAGRPAPNSGTQVGEESRAGTDPEELSVADLASSFGDDA